MGMVAGLCLAGSFYFLTIAMEHRLIEETLSAELEDYIARFESDPVTPPPSSTSISLYVIGPRGTGAPAELRGLGSGLHQVRIEDRNHYAEVRLRGERQFVVLYGDEQIRHREDQFRLFLGAGVVVMTLFSALLGFWLAGRVVAPVRDLAGRLAGLRPRERPAPLAADFPRDEVGTLAREFDAYQKRLADFVERERSFTADVSHELRTPLAVIEGATDVLLEDHGLEEAMRSRLDRIARSVREMSELVAALLLLAREEQEGRLESACEADEVLQQVVESHRQLVKDKPVTIRLDNRPGTRLPVHCALLRVVLANLLRNALSHTSQGTVYIRLDEHGMQIEDTGSGIPREQIQRIFDRFYTGTAGGSGLGLSLVKRICQRYGWKIDFASREGQGTVFRLLFPPASQAGSLQGKP
jgi:signal transduction histidine kinase